MPTSIPVSTPTVVVPTWEDYNVLEKRVKELENKTPVPTVPPVPPTVPPPAPIPTSERKLIGGWRIREAFASGNFALHTDGTEILMRGFDPLRGGKFFLVFDIKSVPAAQGSVSDMPELPIKRAIDAPWWDIAKHGDCYGLAHFEGRYCAFPRKWYDTSPREDCSIFFEDWEERVINFPGPADAQRFDGFVKGKPGTIPLLGGGAYDSGQGSVLGPTAGTMAGEVKLVYENPDMPGANLENWNKRAPRPANYIPFVRTWWDSSMGPRVPHPDVNQDDARFTWNSQTNYWKGQVKDSWPAWMPREVNGKMEGRWASDVLEGGGLILPEGVCYWPRFGTGMIDYNLQSLCFAQSWQTWECRYDPHTWKLTGMYHCPSLGLIVGQDQDAQGNIYLMEANGWKGDTPYIVDPVLKVFSPL